MKNHPITAVIIPALNEEETIGQVVDRIPNWVNRILVCDNNSTDKTASIAREHGAEVVAEPKQGYGAACMGGIKHLEALSQKERPEVVVFLDGDLSDDPLETETIIIPIVDRHMDFVIGSRVLGPCEKGALTPTQRFGNWLSCKLTNYFFKVKYTDLGPFRAIRWDALQSLNMDHLGYGWTIQMQVRSARKGLRITEVPVSYKNRAGGKSKVSGTIKGVLGAGSTILYVIFEEAAASALNSHPHLKEWIKPAASLWKSINPLS